MLIDHPDAQTSDRKEGAGGEVGDMATCLDAEWQQHEHESRQSEDQKHRDRIQPVNYFQHGREQVRGPARLRVSHSSTKKSPVDLCSAGMGGVMAVDFCELSLFM